MLFGLSGREGGGEDTLARVSCPPSIFTFMKLKKHPVQCLKKSWYSFLTWLLYFINHYFLCLSNMLRGLSGKEGGGEDTPAGVSCPPPIFTFIKFKKNPVQWLKKSWYIFLTWLLYFINLSNILHGMSRKRGWGLKIPWPGYLAPPTPFLCSWNFKKSSSVSEKELV